jgi:hypothetical protein
MLTENPIKRQQDTDTPAAADEAVSLGIPTTSSSSTSSTSGDTLEGRLQRYQTAEWRADQLEKDILQLLIYSPQGPQEGAGSSNDIIISSSSSSSSSSSNASPIVWLFLVLLYYYGYYYY